MLCSKCGAENISGSTFCIKCGANLKEIQSMNGNTNTAPINEQVTPPTFVEPQIQPMQQSINNQQFVQQPMNNNVNTPNNKYNKKLIFLFIVIAIFIIVLGVVAFLYFKKDKNKNLEMDITDSTAFFIENEDKKYALFNDEGNQLTEFIFTSVDDFVNGTALVEKDNAYGIIDSNGKMTVDFGKYSYITTVASMYKIRAEDYHSILIDGTGKVLYDLNDNNLITFIGGYYSILKEKSTKTYKVLNPQGIVMTSFPVVENIDHDPTTNEIDEFISVFYNNKNFILNEKTGKEVISFNDDKHYCVNQVEEDGKIIILNSCASWYQSQDKTYYKFIKDGKLYDLNDQCDSVYYENNNIVCRKDYKKYLLDNNQNVGVEISNKIYVDNNTYAQNKGSLSNGVDFYMDGKVAKNVSCRYIKEAGYAEKGFYVLESNYSSSCNTSSDAYEFYNSKGEKAFGKSYAKANSFDQNGLAKVSDDEKKYYLIDTTGKKVSDDFDNISLSNNYYIVTKNNLKGILDKDGKQVLDCKYSNIEITKKQNKYFAKLSTTDSKYILYDISKKVEVLNLEGSPNFYEHYILITKDNHKQYYAYNGKLLYESK